MAIFIVKISRFKNVVFGCRI